MSVTQVLVATAAEGFDLVGVDVERASSLVFDAPGVTRPLRADSVTRL